MAKTQFGQDTQQQNALAQRQRADKNKWEELLAMLNFAHKGDPQTMLGFGLGRLLRDGFNTWMRNYKARDEDKHRRAMREYNQLSDAEKANMSFEDWYKNQWHPRYKADKAMQTQDAQARAAMGDDVNIPSTAPIILPEMNLGQKGQGEYVPVSDEMAAATHANNPVPAGSAKPADILGQGPSFFPMGEEGRYTLGGINNVPSFDWRRILSGGR